MDFRDKLRVATHLVGPDEVRLQAAPSKDIGDGTTREVNHLRERPGRPPAPPRWRRRQRKLDNSLNDGGRHRVVLSSRLGPIEQALNATIKEASAYARNGFGREVETIRDIRRTKSLRGKEDDPTTPYQSGRLRRSTYNCEQASSRGAVQLDVVHVSHIRIDAT